MLARCWGRPSKTNDQAKENPFLRGNPLEVFGVGRLSGHVSVFANCVRNGGIVQSSLPDFMNFKLFGKTILVVNIKFRLFFWPSTQPVRK